MRSTRSAIREARKRATKPLSNSASASTRSRLALATAAPSASTMAGSTLAQRQRQVDVVDHHVEHHRNVEVARVGRAGAHRLQQRRPLGHVEEPHRLQRGALQEAAGGDDARPRGELGDAGGVLGVGGERLFHVDRLAGRQGRESGLGVSDRGRGDRDDVDRGDQLGFALEHLAAAARRQRLGVHRVVVVDAGQDDARQRGVLLRVIAPENARADHAGAQDFSHRGSFRGAA